MATYRLKRKTFAFALTKQAFAGAKNAFKAGNIGTGLKQTGAMLGRGALGVGKLAVGTAAVGTAAAGLAGLGTFGASANQANS